MDVVSVSPYRTGSVLWRSRRDRWTLTVICKGTYALVPGEAVLASEQEEVNERDNFWDDDPRRSVHAPSDIAPFKPRADVMLVGHAFAPRSEAARSLIARLIVGDLEKAIEVFCPRVWTREGELREGPRWSKMPLRYEYAAGGIDTWNPVGVSENAPPDAYGQRPLPHLQPPGLRVAQWRDIFAPTGLGPIASTWLLRREKLGRRAEGWSDEGWPQIPLDDEFDGEFFQAAPPDQQLETLHDDESIVMEYLHPDHPRLATKLPGLHPHAFVDIPGSPARDLVMTADTLWIDTDRSLCTLTWRGQVAVDGPDQPGRVILAIEETGKHLTWASLESTTPPHGRRALGSLPFRLGDAASPSEEDAPRTRAGLGGRRTTMQIPAGQESHVPLPAWLSRVSRADSDLVESSTNVGARLDPVTPTASASALTAPGPVAVRVPPPADTALELLWYSLGLAGRLRKNATWGELLRPQKGAKRNTMTMVSVAAPDSDEAVEQALEMEVSTILARGTPSVADLEATLFDTTAPGGVLAPELTMLAGELDLPFDDTAWVRALMVAAAPLSRSDGGLAALLELASEMVKTPLGCAPSAAAGLREGIQEAWSAANRSLPADHLEVQTARGLLLDRAYQRRDLMGDTWVRALFTPAGSESVPAYLPEAAAKRLPLFARFPARVIVEVVPRQDQDEEQPVGLKLGAIARVITRTHR